MVFRTKTVHFIWNKSEWFFILIGFILIHFIDNLFFE